MKIHFKLEGTFEVPDGHYDTEELETGVLYPTILASSTAQKEVEISLGLGTNIGFADHALENVGIVELEYSTLQFDILDN